MKKFFNWQDFPLHNTSPEKQRDWAVENANAKLEREGKVVYGSPNGRSTVFVPGQTWNTHDDKTGRDTHRALLINIEPIEQCKHPSEKVKASLLNVFRDDSDLQKYCFRCACGAKVKPSAFTAVDDE